jgi:cellulose synthase/poly-beta-1,6-N-acetylglucosamine synthase-like glycosyltransferase
MLPALLWIAAALTAFYILAGYPLLLGRVRGNLRPPVRKDEAFQTTVSVILSVYNGAAFLRQKLDCLLALDYDQSRMQILVVSDGSTDATESIAREYADRGVELIVCPHAGKSAALNAAFPRATGELLFLTDVRQPLEKRALAHLVANFADPSVGAVTGEMRLLPGESGEQEDMGLYWRYELWARRRHSEIDSLFNTTGCIYAMRRSLATPLAADTLSDDAILPLRVFFEGYRVIFDPEAIAYDYPAVPGTEFRRRWRNLAGLWQVHTRMPQLFTSANRMRTHFWPHKLGRLVLPWALLVMILSTMALPMPRSWRWLLLGVEVAPLGLAALDPWIPKGLGIVKRLTSVARTFAVMNAASMAAVAVFFIPAQNLWKPTTVKLGGK